MSANPITKDDLSRLGFCKKKNGDWLLNLQSPSSYPTRVHVLTTGRDRATLENVLIEQAEYTGELAEGIGESDWTWDHSSGCVHVVIRESAHLAQLLEIIRGEVKLAERVVSNKANDGEGE